MEDNHKQKPYPLRFDKKLRESLQESADQNKRSLNTEIVTRLEQSLGQRQVINTNSRGHMLRWMETLAYPGQKLRYRNSIKELAGLVLSLAKEGGGAGVSPSSLEVAMLSARNAIAEVELDEKLDSAMDEEIMKDEKEKGRL